MSGLKGFVKGLVLALFAFGSGSVGAPDVQAQWAFRAGGANWESAEDLEIAPGGAIVVIGRSTSTADWDPDPASVVSVQGSGFLASYSNDGELGWVRGLDGIGTGVTVGPAGDIFAASGVGSCVVSRLSSSGHERWSREIVDRTCNALAVGAEETLWMVVSGGYFARLDSAGNTTWFFDLQTGGIEGFKLALNPAGGVVVIGPAEQTFDLDPGPGEAVVTVSGTPVYFLASYSGDGELLWFRSLEATTAVQLWDVDVDQDGSAYVAGTLSGTTDFGSGSVELDRGAFVAKYDAAGSHQWTTTSSSGSSRALHEAEGVVTVAGAMSDGVNFDPARRPELGLDGHGMFVAEFDSSGNYLSGWALLGSDSLPEALERDGLGNTYLTGFFWGTVDFDPGSESVLLRAHPDGQQDQPDFFLSKHGPQGTFSVRAHSTTAFPDSGMRIEVFPNPASHTVSISVASGRSQRVQIQLIDALGRVVRTMSTRVVAGENLTLMNLDGLSAGMYLLRVGGSPDVSRVVMVRDSS